jgi:hypothetical protein
MAVKSPNPDPPTPASKDAARQCLLLADKLLKELNFKACREQLQKAKELDPTNPYIYAFEDRIAYFEQQEKKKNEAKPAKPVVIQNVQDAVAKSQAHPQTSSPMPPLTPPSEKKESVQPDPEERRMREQEARALAEERKRKQLEAKIADEVKKRLELQEQSKSATVDPTEQLIRKEIEARVAAERKKQDADIWANTEARLVEERKRQEDEVRAAVEARLAEERIKKEMENRLIEERMRKEVEIRAAIEARLAEEKMKRDMEERILGDRRRQEAEIRAAVELRLAEEQRKREAEAKASMETRLAEEKLRQEMEARALEEQRRKEAEAKAVEERKKAEEMRRQLQELTQALEREKKAREEIATKHLQNPVKQLRASLESAWVNGAPKDEVAGSLHQMAVTLAIPPEVEQSVLREVKLEMYSRAVKEVISKRKLLRNSSSTLEWIRKVYQVSVTEYLENESRFLLDLVADQYNGTVLLVSKTIGTPEDLTPRLKSAGFAVVLSQTPDAALEKIEKVNPNIILCDTEFPEGGLSGLRFLHVVRASSKFNFVPFIFLADATDVDQLQSSELKPNEGFVKRPVVWDELTNCINEKLRHFREYISSMG